MACIYHLYAPEDTVWVITDCHVKQGTVIRMFSSVLTTGTTVKYDVRFVGESTTSVVEEEDMFDTKNEAYDELKTR